MYCRNFQAMEGVTVKKENIKSEYKKEEVAEEETGTEDSSEVENVMLRNIELDDNTHQALIVNDFPVTDSDGNLKITTMTESGVRTFIIEYVKSESILCYGIMNQSRC